MIRTIKRSIVIMLSFVMTIMISGGVFTTYAATTVDEYTYVANIVDAENNPVQGVTVGFYKDGEAITKMGYDSSFNYVATPVTRTSDASGEVSIGVGAYSSNGIDSSCAGKTIEVKVEGDEYTCSDTHSFELNDSVSIIKIDGTALTYGMSPAIIVVSSASASQEYTVTFNANGGSVDPASAETVEGKLASLPTPTNSNENMVFLGWFTAATEGDAVTPDTVFSANTEIFAHWMDASSWNENDFTYNADNTTLTGLSESGKAKIKVNSELVLPDSHNGVDIIAIGNGTNGLGTFGIKEGATLDEIFVPTKVKLPAKLETIGNFAFSAATETADDGVNQKGLTEIEFPNTLKSIGISAFSNVPLTSVKLPDSITTLGQGAFTGLEKIKVCITEVTLPSGITEIPNALFNNQKIEGEITIPDGVKKIGNLAFAGCKISKVNFPDGLESIGNSAFQSNELTEVEIPASVKTIGSQAFRFSATGEGGEGKISKLVLNEGLTTINANAFAGNKLTIVEMPSTVTTLNKSAFASNAGIDDGKVLIKVTTEEQFNGTSKFIANSDGHKVSVDVTLDANLEGSEPVVKKTGLGLVLSEDDLAAPASTDAAKEFIGWFTEKDGGEAVDASKVYEKNTTLYAHWKDLKAEAEAADKAADEAVKAADEAAKAADEAAKSGDTAQAAAAAAKAKEAADTAKKAADEAKTAADAYVDQLDKEGSSATDEEKAAAKELQTKAAERAEAADKAAKEAAAKKDAADKKAADEAKAMATTSVTVSAKTVNAAAISAAIANAGGDPKYVTTLVLDKGVKKISKGALAGTNVKTLVVKSKKLKKKSVKGSLKGSSVTKVQVKVGKAKTNKKYVKKYKKIFTKKNAGKKVKVTK